METRALGQTGLRVSVIGLGALEIGRNWGIGDRTRPEETRAIEVVRGSVELGITLIDTARAYHKSEERIGKALTHVEATVVLSSKCGEHSKEPDTFYDFSYDAVSRSIDESLELLNVEQIDIMHIHFGPDPQLVLDEGNALRAMKAAREAKKIRFLGASAKGDTARQCIKCGEFDVVQLDYSLLNRVDEDLLDLAGELGVGVLVRGALARGLLTPKTIAFLETEEGQSHRERVLPLLEAVGHDPEELMKLALHFAKRHKAVSAVLIGTKSIDNLERCAHLLAAAPDSTVLNRLEELTRP